MSNKVPGYYAIIKDILGNPKLSVSITIISGIVAHAPINILGKLGVDGLQTDYKQQASFLFMIALVWFAVVATSSFFGNLLKLKNNRKSRIRVNASQVSDTGIAILLTLKEVAPSQLELNPYNFEVKRLRDFGLISTTFVGIVVVGPDIWDDYRLSKKGEKFLWKNRRIIANRGFSTKSAQNTLDLIKHLCRGIS